MCIERAVFVLFATDAICCELHMHCKALPEYKRHEYKRQAGSVCCDMFSLAYAGCKGSRCVFVGALPRKEGEAPKLEQLIILYISVFTNPLYCNIHASDIILCAICGTEAVVLSH